MNEVTVTDGFDARRALATVAIAGGLPLLIVIIYSNFSDIVIRNFAVPSPLQPLIALLAVTVFLLRAHTRPIEIMVAPATLLLATYWIIVFLSSNWAHDPALSDVRAIEIGKDFAIMVVAASLAVSWRAVHIALASLVTAAVILSSLTLIQVVTKTENEFFGFATVTTASVYGDVFDARSSGPIDDPNFYGQMLLICVPLAAALAVIARRRRTKVIAAGAAFLVAVATILTYSRGATLALVPTAICIGWILRLKPKHAGGAVIVALLIALVLPVNVTRRLLTIEDLFPQKSAITERDASIEKRELLTGVGWAMFKDNLFLGVGAGNFTDNFNRYAVQVGSAARQYEDPGQGELPHSLYLEIASESGVLGLICYLSAIAATFLMLVRTRRLLLEHGDEKHAALSAAVAVSLAAYLLTSLFLHSGFQRHFWIVMAFALATSRLTLRGESDAGVLA